ncbi:MULTISPECIES: Holliday junction resolvase RuvX [Exiguobacterium]|jgi:putative Holliday junction resolvase|uniref:Putative pre-16S rRNA nuclease n=4 Tax=Exiguobacterium TaxID=33986 RepID=C4L553_EXISA|nr:MULTISPECIES: Holliday junction resolvase RuvX [Exiguobacterium]MCC9623419.1 Holliday junction resolvase RuvX [Thalassospira sp. MA62]QPI66814.1 Holliday junction resolvase RuvX [Exiguobacterium sp. PBE]ACQ71638.1 Holliday junction resolvase YqgF [Exiguobacterium sp. AT1b]MBG0916538.1 Holliday junction resolvase RuvX [Exiguobacterium sp. SRB7LM]MBQ6458967.1 Holliday junction resolvase RuvX [Exiguobacterium sp.]
MKRVMGLDVGSKTIGVAVSDLMGWTAQGVETVYWTEPDFDEAVRLLRPFIEQYDVKEVVVGHPKNMNGTVGPRGEASEAFAEAFTEQTGLPCVLVDERLTTMQAERMLISADVSRKKRKAVIDKMAAVMILQNYLDRSGK